MAGDEYVLVQPPQRLQGHQPQVWVGLVQPGLDAVEYVVAGEHHALLLGHHRSLVQRMPGHVDHLEGVIADTQGHPVLEGDHRRIGPVSLQQRRLLGAEGADAGGVFGHVGVQDAGSYTLMGDDRSVEEGVAGPVVAVGFGVDYVTQQPAFLDLGLEPHGRAGLVGSVDQHDAIRRGHKAKVAPPYLGLHPYIACKLFHCAPRWE